jgi:hypothetical protein
MGRVYRSSLIGEDLLLIAPDRRRKVCEFVQGLVKCALTLALQGADPHK